MAGLTFRLGQLPDALQTDASNNVGIGGSPSGSYKLEVTGTAKVSSTLLVSGAATLSSTLSVTGNTGIGVAADTNVRLEIQGSNTSGGHYIFYTMDSASSALFTLQNNGLASFTSSTTSNLLSSTSAPSLGNAHFLGKSNSSGNTSYAGLQLQSSTGKGCYLTMGDNSNTGWYGAQASYVTLAGTLGTGMKFRVDASNDKGTTIFNNGNLSVHTIYDLGYILNLYSADLANTAGTCVMRNGANNAGGYFVLFQNNSGGTAGVISQTGNTTINYGASSDYRLKEDLKDFTGLDKVSAIKVYDFKWVAEDLRAYGTMAHELQEIIPTAVTGTKDEMNKDGSIKTQQVDYSKLVPILIKSIQEQQIQIQNLQEQNQDLKSRLDKAGL